MGRLEGKVAFITGAARGQGRSHAVRFAEEGANIIAIDLCEDVSITRYDGATEEDLRQTQKMVEALGRRIIATKADVRDVDRLRAAVDAGVSELGRLDVVVANAGIGSMTRTVTELSEAEWQGVLDINLTGVWHTAAVSVPHLVAGGSGGAILMTGSAASLKGFANIGQYVAAKHGVLGLARALAIELGQYGIRVNSVHPGNVNTDMIQNPGMFKLFCPDIENPTSEDFAKRARSLHLLPISWVEPVDVSNALVFLASDEARYITGVALPVDGGTTAR
jgi:(+)-trans-carveol dehydrogenase